MTTKIATQLTVKEVKRGFQNMCIQEARRIMAEGARGNASWIADSALSAAKEMRRTENDDQISGYVMGMMAAITVMNTCMGDNPHRLVENYRSRVIERIAALGRGDEFAEATIKDSA